MITPQTMSVITRIFPPEKRGAAMGVWGTVAGVATLVGPLLGGILTDAFGWEWIFFVNIPVGIVGIVLAQIFVPNIPTRNHSFDWVGVILSAVGMFALVFGIQDGEKYNWSGWIWALIIGGLVVMALFIWWESKVRTEPLLPLSLFADRNFTLSNICIAAMGFAVSGMMVPTMFFLQLVGGMSPTQSALMMVPMAVATGVLAPIIGRLVDRLHPRLIIGSAMALMAGSVIWLGIITRPETPVWLLLIPNFLMGVASAGIWAPLAATATRNLQMSQAGAGSGVYNTTRMIGSVLGSAAVGALLQTRLADELPGLSGSADHISGRLPEFVRSPFSEAMGQTLYLPGVVLLIGVVAAMFFARPRHLGVAAQSAAAARADTSRPIGGAVEA
ncbi:hypothetical protein GCM10027169_03500 [Gordonia jinhuaensis]|uniref:Major facilitator superfamily (MFS) profile domain-containing protein n=1 Tax=Gordonia jinhuaensis TaxID=1517702 RepID=A0A916STZ9_9ACTN|nr:hypothetical protein GCM10011489_00450 [Gordonia jinhuaensis]